MRRRQFLESVAAAAAFSAGTKLQPFAIGQSRPSMPTVTEPRDFFYRPEYGYTGDIQPFFKDGKFWLFFSPCWHDAAHCPPGEPLYWPGSWYLVSTEDFVHFTEHGRVLERGTSADQDMDCYSGSVIEAHGKYHIFYAGHNGLFPKEGKRNDGVMHAVSDDLLHWTKQPQDTFYADAELYEPNDWRDPFAFWNEEDQQYWMLVVASAKAGPPRRRGCTALCTSTDLKRWKVREPFGRPQLYGDHECPDLFRMGDWWYLVFSEFTDQHHTHYRRSRSLKGPWLADNNDSFDGRSFYAGKTAFDGRRRFIFGWNPTRFNKDDYLRWNLDCGFMPCKPYPDDLMIGPSGWDWGGNLAVHELVQNPDGSLAVKVPDAVDRAFSKNSDYRFETGAAGVEVLPQGVALNAPDGFLCCPAGDLPDQCKLETTVVFATNTGSCGLMLRTSRDLDSAYYIRLDARRNRMVLDSWPRSGDIPFDVGTERPIPLSPGLPVHLRVFVDHTMCVAYANDRVVFNTRLYDLKEGSWGVFVSEGSAKFHEVRLFAL